MLSQWQNAMGSSLLASILQPEISMLHIFRFWDTTSWHWVIDNHLKTITSTMPRHHHWDISSRSLIYLLETKNSSGVCLLWPESPWSICCQSRTGKALDIIIGLASFPCAKKNGSSPSMPTSCQVLAQGSSRAYCLVGMWITWSTSMWNWHRKAFHRSW